MDKHWSNYYNNLQMNWITVKQDNKITLPMWGVEVEAITKDGSTIFCELMLENMTWDETEGNGSYDFHDIVKWRLPEKPKE